MSLERESSRRFWSHDASAQTSRTTDDRRRRAAHRHQGNCVIEATRRVDLRRLNFMKTIHTLLTAFLLAILPLIGVGAETIRRLPECEVVATEERQAAALNVGAVMPASHPRFPVETLADGRKRFVYQADFQKDKKAADAVSSGTFADRGLAETHTSGIYGAPTVFKFAAPGDIETIEVTAVYFNSVDAAPHAYDIHYSFDGRKFKPLVEKTSAQPGDVKLDGRNAPPQGTRRVWIKFAGLGNPRLTLKQVGVTLTYRETR